MLITLYKQKFQQKIQKELTLFSCLIILLLNFTGCSIYKMTIKQGNEITQEQLNQLKIKTSKNKVKELFGTPALEPIDTNRLDYFYSIKDTQNKINKKQHLILFFDKKDQLTHYEGDFKIDNLPKTKH